MQDKIDLVDHLPKLKKKLKEDRCYLNSVIIEDKHEEEARKIIELDKKRKEKMLKIKKSSFILPSLASSASVKTLNGKKNS